MTDTQLNGKSNSRPEELAALRRLIADHFTDGDSVPTALFSASILSESPPAPI